ncbi:MULTISPECIES: hypothetical protein [Bacillus cereus group]|uniref:hypothetical protein n=1 Tax=Bacillus cereus group TaxID=86661 RepID=UPI001300C590|nr:MULTISPECIES: hypothetical protein [Bacillus cereus group]QUG99363.1 hypothetical protein HCM98_31635 [Bacillus tropicus]
MSFTTAMWFMLAFASPVLSILAVEGLRKLVNAYEEIHKGSPMLDIPQKRSAEN